MKTVLKRLVPRSVIRAVLPRVLKRQASRSGLKLHIGRDHIDVVKHTKVMRLSAQHAVYLPDLIASFDYYADAVLPFTMGDQQLIDFSTPRYHDVIGFDRYPIYFPSLAEPIVTAGQSLEFARLSDGMTVLDLGAYSGLTAILFSLAVGAGGTVVAVEADGRNIECIKRNFANFHKYANGTLLLSEGAVWDHDQGLAFSSEGNMGSSASNIVGRNRGSVTNVPSFTLSSLSRMTNLTRVDFVKCDVEGAERVIFKDRQFFARFSPRIVIEPHIVEGASTAAACISELRRHGYTCQAVDQRGVHLPLIECIPPAR